MEPINGDKCMGRHIQMILVVLGVVAAMVSTVWIVTGKATSNLDDRLRLVENRQATVLAVIPEMQRSLEELKTDIKENNSELKAIRADVSRLLAIQEKRTVSFFTTEGGGK